MKNGNHFELIEVKAKSYDSLKPEIAGARGGIKSGMLPYIQDAAFQKWVLQQAFPDAKINTYLMMPDKQKVCEIDNLNQMFKINDRSDIDAQIPPHINGYQLANNLLAKVSVDQYVDDVLTNPIDIPGGAAPLPDLANLWAASYKIDQKLVPILGKQCGACQFKTDLNGKLKSGFHECWKEALGWSESDFTEGTILDIWNFRGKSKLMDQGIYKINQVNRDDIGHFEDETDVTGLSRMQRQWLQVGGIPKDHDHGDFYFDQSLAGVEMSKWKYPYHLIDFETSAVALPFHKDMRPYEQVAFQYSHHIIESDGSIRHAGQFLCVEPGAFPNYEFARALKVELEADEGSVFMWSHHENTILSAIIRQLDEDTNRPDDADQLKEFLITLIKGGNRAMIDLCTFAEKAFYHPDTNGGNSIKKVLPAILKVSEKLQSTYVNPIYGRVDGIVSLNEWNSDGFVWLTKDEQGEIINPYTLLKAYAEDILLDSDLAIDESIISEGGAAATGYARLQFESLDDASRVRIKSSLLRYCELDTLAMVMIVQAWNSMAGN